MSCNRCSQTHSTVQAFLLTCYVCNRKWHHRCHIPPVTDSELILRIRAHNVGDSANGLQAWKCKRCVRSGAGSTTPVPNLPLPHSSAGRAPPRIANDVVQGGKDHDDTIIVIDDSDSDTLPPDRPPPSSKLGSSGSKRALAATHAQSPPIAKAINPNLGPSKPPPLVVRDTTSNHPSSSHDNSMKRPQPTSSSKQQLAEPTTATNDDDVVIISPSQIQNKETRRNQFRRDAQDREKNKRMDHRQRQQQLKIKTEMKVDIETLDASSQELIQQPQTPEITSPARHLSVEAETFVGLSAGKDPENVSHPEVNLAPRWFHDDLNDIWSRALKIKTFSIAPSSTACTLPSSTTRRKVQAKRLNEAQPPIFSFYIVQWENQMKRVQR